MTKMKKKTTLLANMALLLALILLSSGCGRETSAQEAGKKPVETVKVEVVTIEPSPIRDILTLPGQTEAVRDIKLAAEYEGKVESIGPTEGDRVEKGQSLAQIDLALSKASLNRARANFRLAEDLAKRRKELKAKGMISQEELDQALTDLIVARNNLNDAQVVHRQSQVISPINGTLNHLYVDPGEFVHRGDPLADLVDLEKIRIYVNIPEMDVRYIKKGDKALVTIDAYPDSQWAGQVDFVAFKADEATRTFRVRVVVDNADGRIRPGMIARASFLQQVVPDAMIAPLFSLVDKGGERVVFVERNGTAHSRVVEIGVIDGDKVQISKGLSPGDRLIVTGQTEVEEGTRVTVQ